MGNLHPVTLFCVLGDAHLDVVVCPDGPVAEETDTPARTWVGAGGQAANVAAWIVALGGQARLVAARGTDLAAQLVASDLRQRGVDLRGPVVEGPTGVVVSLSRGGASRSRSGRVSSGGFEGWPQVIKYLPSLSNFTTRVLP